MIGKYSEKDFDQHDYNEFYESHTFQPLSERDALNAHQVIPRFGWAYDVVSELKPKTLLDLGCLDGSFALTVAKHLGVSVTGIDLTKDGIELAAKRAEENNLPAQFKQGAIEDWLLVLAARGKKYDVITLFEIIEHVEDPKVVLDLIDKVLAPGGTVLVSTPAYESPLYGKDDEQNKCHVRLYTTKDEDYSEANKYGTIRKATSLPKEIGPERIKEIGVYSELINCRYQ